MLAVDQPKTIPNLIKRNDVIGEMPVTMAVELFEGTTVDFDKLIFLRYLVLTARHPEWC